MGSPPFTSTGILDANMYTNFVYLEVYMKKRILISIISFIILLTNSNIKIIAMNDSTLNEIKSNYDKQNKINEYFNIAHEEINNFESNYEKIIELKSLLYEYKDDIVLPNQIWNTYSSEELSALFKTVETEVRGCDFDAKCNVASVIFNRLETGKWGDTLKKVCYSPSQFAHYRGMDEIEVDTVLACEYVFYFGDTAQGCLYFQSSGYTETFCGAHYVFHDNAIHYFYK